MSCPDTSLEASSYPSSAPRARGQQGSRVRPPSLLGSLCPGAEAGRLCGEWRGVIEGRSRMTQALAVAAAQAGAGHT